MHADGLRRRALGRQRSRRVTDRRRDRGCRARSGVSTDLSGDDERQRRQPATMTAAAVTWSVTDLERRLCRVLDMAARVVEHFGETGYSDSATSVNDFGPEKV